MTITKSEIITRICEKTNVSNVDATNLLEHTFEIIKASIERGEQVKISGFGSFAVRTKRQRNGRNPRTGAQIVIPEHKILAFKASPVMRKTVAMTPMD